LLLYREPLIIEIHAEILVLAQEKSFYWKLVCTYGKECLFSIYYGSWSVVCSTSYSMLLWVPFKILVSSLICVQLILLKLINHQDIFQPMLICFLVTCVSDSSCLESECFPLEVAPGPIEAASQDLSPSLPAEDPFV